MYLSRLEGYKRFLFNCYIPKNDGTTTEIDVILLHDSGIYVFESKNYSGWIFGNENQKNWTQTLPAGRGKSHKTQFLNPIIQNKVHLKYLKGYLKDFSEVPLFSYIVFSDRCTLKNITLTSKEHFVINRYNILKAVRENVKTVGVPYSKDTLDAIYEKLYPLTQADNELKLEHIKNIENKYKHSSKPKPDTDDIKKPETSETELETVSSDDNAISDKICPRCGGKLILRTAKKGNNAGNSFWGCSNYPKCHYIENIK